MKIASIQTVFSLFIFGIWLIAGCGGAGQSGTGAGDRPRVCFTEPSVLAERAVQVGTGPPGALEAAGLVLHEEQFSVLVISAGGAEQLDWLWDAHRSDLEYGLEIIRECGAEPFVAGTPKAIDGAVEGYKVPIEAVCADGTPLHVRVKIMRFETCLYVSAIN